LLNRSFARLVAAFLGFALAAAAFGGVYPDYTTISEERDKDHLWEAVDMVTGWVRDYPALFYQMRLARLRRVLQRNPMDFASYDLAAMAADKLGDDSLALQLEEELREHLALVPKGSDMETPWQSYYHHRAFFLVQRWIRAGAHKDHMEDVTAAHVILVTYAPRLNEHGMGFGFTFRIILERLLKPVEKVSASSNDDDRLIDCLVWLVQQGPEWRTQEIYRWIGNGLAYKAGGNAAYLAYLAANNEGNGPPKRFGGHANVAFDPLDWELYAARYPAPWYRGSLRRMYLEQRKAAAEEDRHRDGFMVPRLQAGRHPDTDPHFWDGYRPIPSPALIDMNLWQQFLCWWDQWGQYFYCCGIPLAIMFLVIFARHRAARRRAAAS